MNMPIDRETLQHWLEQGEPVTVVDLQPEEAYREWRIPGSIHFDKYEALKAGDPAAMEDVELPEDRPVVTVCPRGKTSALAAEQLRARGYDAQSLAGGFRAWSLAWNAAEIALPSSPASVLQVRRTGKGCLSYLVASDGEAAVVDASVEPEVYLRLADEHGWRISAVVETHIQADHVSRSQTLAEQTGAALYLPAQERVSFPHTAVHDGDAIPVGRALLRALHTPGHTPESTSYLLDRDAVFTGDTLFLRGVGRPDLDASEGEAARRAGELHESLVRLSQLGDEVQVLPAHTSEPVPFDGAPLAATLSDVRERVDALRKSKQRFVDSVIAHLPPPPPNFDRIVELNEAGHVPDDPSELEAGANRCAA